MKRVDIERLGRISGFDVDIRAVHQRSSNISLLRLKRREAVEMESWDFDVHLMVLAGEIEVTSGESEEVFKTGCLVSILPGQSFRIKAIEDSRVVIVRDDPLWALRERRSVRKYAEIPVPKEIIEKIVDFSRLAPSGGNLQPWRVYITSSEEKKRALAEASFGQEHVAEAPWVIVIAAVPKESGKEYGRRGEELYSIQDTASLALYIMLTAKAYGLDTCWVGAFDEEEVRKIVGMRDDERPVVLIPVGYADESPEVPERKPLRVILKEF